MKKLISALVVLGMYAFNHSYAQTKNTQITKSNSWLKAGIQVGLPIEEVSKQSNAVLSLDLKGQFLSTPHVGIGAVTGYSHFFPKEDGENFGSIPVGLFGRYYFKREGIFIGSDIGYSFQTGSGTNKKGGVFVKPQVGYHNRDWNFFTYYNGIFRGNQQGGHIQHLGVGTTYNFMFK